MYVAVQANACASIKKDYACLHVVVLVKSMHAFLNDRRQDCSRAELCEMLLSSSHLPALWFWWALTYHPNVLLDSVTSEFVEMSENGCSPGGVLHDSERLLLARVTAWKPLTHIRRSSSSWIIKTAPGYFWVASCWLKAKLKLNLEAIFRCTVDIMYKGAGLLLPKIKIKFVYHASIPATT